MRLAGVINKNPLIDVRAFLCSDGQYVQGDGSHDDTTGIIAAVTYAATLAPTADASLTGSPTVWSGFDAFGDANIGTTYPGAGTWTVGRRVVNAAPAAGQPKAWVCTTAPNTWTSEGNL